MISLNTTTLSAAAARPKVTPKKARQTARRFITLIRANSPFKNCERHTIRTPLRKDSTNRGVIVLNGVGARLRTRRFTRGERHPAIVRQGARTIAKLLLHMRLKSGSRLSGVAATGWRSGRTGGGPAKEQVQVPVD